MSKGHAVLTNRCASPWMQRPSDWARGGERTESSSCKNPRPVRGVLAPAGYPTRSVPTGGHAAPSLWTSSDIANTPDFRGVCVTWIVHEVESSGQHRRRQGRAVRTRRSADQLRCADPRAIEAVGRRPNRAMDTVSVVQAKGQSEISDEGFEGRVLFVVAPLPEKLSE